MLFAEALANRANALDCQYLNSCRGPRAATNVIELRKGTFEFKRPWVVGLRYEKSITHTFGFQGGVHKMFQEVVRPHGYENVQFDKNPLYYRVGGMVTVGPWIVQAGPVWTNANSGSIGFEIRGTKDIVSWKGRRHFGIP